MDGRSRTTAPVPLAALAACAALVTPAPAVASEGAGSDRVEIALLGEQGPMRLVLDVEIEGESVSSLWDEAVAALLRRCDRDGDGALDEEEAAGLPSAYGLRQLTWGVFRLAGPAAPWGQLDADGSGRVGPAELSAFFRGQGAGPVLVGVGRPPFTARLNEAIRRHLDADEDGRLDAAELREAEALLGTLDRNGDRRLAAEEIDPAVSYPGTQGTTRLAPSHPDRRSDEVWALPLALLPAFDDGGLWAEGLARHPHVSTDAEALRAWRDAPPACKWTVVFSTTADAAEGVAADPPAGRLTPGGWRSAAFDDLAWHLRADEGTLADGLRANRAQLAARFAAADVDADGEVGPGDLADPSLAPLALALPWADRDGDGAASRAELDAWSDLIETLARGRILVSVLDHGRGLFEFIDADHDGALAARELRTAGGRLGRAGCMPDGALEPARLPRTLIGSVSRGQPARILAERPPAGPAWFDGMDRNRDGDLAADEWIGDPARFHALDADRDGLLSVEEAMTAP